MLSVQNRDEAGQLYDLFLNKPPSNGGTVVSMQSPTPLCYDCKYLHDVDSRTCDAFPEGIPDEIWSGTIKHDKPYPSNHGFRFEPKFPNEFLSVTKVANLFSVNPKTIYRALWSERLPAYKIGKTWRIARKDLERFKKNY